MLPGDDSRLKAGIAVPRHRHLHRSASVITAFTWSPLQGFPPAGTCERARSLSAHGWSGTGEGVEFGGDAGSLGRADLLEDLLRLMQSGLGVGSAACGLSAAT